MTDDRPDDDSLGSSGSVRDRDDGRRDGELEYLWVCID